MTTSDSAFSKYELYSDGFILIFRTDDIEKFMKEYKSHRGEVIEYTDFASFPVTGETGKIYVAIDTSYQWNGSAYVNKYNYKEIK
jgi:hypothetical protein